jgi:hypothetical protein
MSLDEQVIKSSGKCHSVLLMPVFLMGSNFGERYWYLYPVKLPQWDVGKSSKKK